MRFWQDPVFLLRHVGEARVTYKRVNERLRMLFEVGAEKLERQRIVEEKARVTEEKNATRETPITSGGR